MQIAVLNSETVHGLLVELNCIKEISAMEEIKQDSLDLNVIKYDVVVHKANIPLRSGESLSIFTEKLRGDVSVFAKNKLNMTNEMECYASEVFSDSVILSVYNFAKGVDSSNRHKYYAVKFSRDDKSGAFSFSDLTEVERFTSWRPKQQMVLKSQEASQEVEKNQPFWSGVI